MVVSETMVRTLEPADLPAVADLDAELTGTPKEPYWTGLLQRSLNERTCIGLAAFTERGLEGYLFGEVRAFEFGSEACGWILAIGVHPKSARHGVGSALLEAADEAFRAFGVTTVRTMVRRADVPLQSFFRRHRFVGGPFVQLELDLALPQSPTRPE